MTHADAIEVTWRVTPRYTGAAEEREASVDVLGSSVMREVVGLVVISLVLLLIAATEVLK